MNLPSLITQSYLDSIASPDDTIAMRVILRRVNSSAPYTLRGKLRQYSLNFISKIGVHALDVPLTIWNNTINPEKVYQDNLSVAHDMQAARSAHLAPLVIVAVPYGHHEGKIPAALVPAPSDSSHRESLREMDKLLRILEAPEQAIDAMGLLLLDDCTDAARATAIRMITVGVEEADAAAAPEPAKAKPEPAPARQMTEEEAAAEKRRKNAEKVARHRAKKRAETTETADIV